MKKIAIFLLMFMFSYGENEYVEKLNAPKEITSQMVVVQVEYNDYNDKTNIGFLVVNKKIQNEVIEIFKEIKEAGFQIEKIIPISEYDWDDDKSMEDNNTSGYNYRYVANTTKLSNHSYGMAIDINPRYNPMIVKGKISPSNGSYSIDDKGTITNESSVVKIFKKRGWSWGGNYKTIKDYQHFEKIIKK